VGINPQLAVLILRSIPALSLAVINGIEVVGEIFQFQEANEASLIPAANSSAKSSPEILRAYLPHIVKA